MQFHSLGCDALCGPAASPIEFGRLGSGSAALTGKTGLQQFRSQYAKKCEEAGNCTALPVPVHKKPLLSVGIRKFSSCLAPDHPLGMFQASGRITQADLDSL